MQKLKKGDDVIVITGKDRGKRGSIIRIDGPDYVIVQGVNSVKKHQKPNPTDGSVGGIIDREMPIHISNVAIYNFSLKMADRVGFKIDDSKNKMRIYRSTGEIIKS